MSDERRMVRDESVLVLVDLQERLAPAIDGIERVMRAAGLLVRAASAQDVPVVFTEQYPRGLGPTDPALTALAPPSSATIEKMHFGGTDEPALVAHLQALGRHRVVLGGTETHICVLQTALGLARAGFDVYVAADAAGSRDAGDREAALARMRDEGLRVVTAEMAVYEWLGRAGTDEFRRLAPLLRDWRADSAGR